MSFARAARRRAAREAARRERPDLIEGPTSRLLIARSGPWSSSRRPRGLRNNLRPAGRLATPRRVARRVVGL